MSKKILFITVDTTGGGAERMMFNIIGSLRPEHDIRLLITSSQSSQGLCPRPLSSKNLNKKHASSALFSIISEVRDFKPDYIFTTSSSIGYMAIIAKYMMLKHKPRVFIRCAVPPSEVYHKSLKPRLLNFIIKTTYNKADLIIAQTNYMRQDLIDSFQLCPQKVKTIRNIVDTSYINKKASGTCPTEYNKNTYNIVAAGALYSVKGFDLLIDALSLIKGQHQNINLYIIGDERYETGYKSFLQSLIDKQGLTQRAFLLGHKSNPYPYICHADLLVMSSRKEGYPNVVLEALFLNTPVVATDCVDWKDVIFSGINGYVVPRNNVSAIANAIALSYDTRFDMKAHRISNFDYNGLFI